VRVTPRRCALSLFPSALAQGCAIVSRRRAPVGGASVADDDRLARGAPQMFRLNEFAVAQNRARSSTLCSSATLPASDSPVRRRVRPSEDPRQRATERTSDVVQNMMLSGKISSGRSRSRRTRISNTCIRR